VSPPMVGADLTNWQLYADLNTSNVVETRYIGGTQPNQWFAEIDAGSGVNWLLTDDLGSIRNVANASGSVIDTINYDAFGTLTESAPTLGGRLKYAGYESDPWAFMYRAGERYYLPSAEIWLTPDPLGLEAESNHYEYADNSPTTASDPTGLYTEAEAKAFMISQAQRCMAALGQTGPGMMIK
jgi:RHS repeat-associated protein